MEVNLQKYRELKHSRLSNQFTCKRKILRGYSLEDNTFKYTVIPMKIMEKRCNELVLNKSRQIEFLLGGPEAVGREEEVWDSGHPSDTNILALPGHTEGLARGAAAAWAGRDRGLLWLLSWAAKTLQAVQTGEICSVYSIKFNITNEKLMVSLNYSTV